MDGGAEMNRKDTLREAEKCVCSDREQQYRPPEDSFSRIADLWNAYKPCGFTAHDVAIMMALLKVGRIATGQFKDDSYVDACGYIACGAEIATSMNE